MNSWNLVWFDSKLVYFGSVVKLWVFIFFGVSDPCINGETFDIEQNLTEHDVHYRTQVQANHKIKMRYVAAYLLSALGGNESPSTDDIKTILESVGVGYDDERAQLVVNQCKGNRTAVIF